MACYLRDCIGDLEKGEQGTFSLGNSLEATGDLEAEYRCLFVHFAHGKNKCQFALVLSKCTS